MRTGLFVVFEGIDRSGKSTQYEELLRILFMTRKNVLGIRFPDRQTETGKIINDYLEKKIELNKEEIYQLFAKNRHEVKDKIVKHLQEGYVVVCDRYVPSGITYGMANGLSNEWCLEREKGLPKPDMIFFMDISPKDAIKRKGFGEEKFETLGFQSEVYKYYMQLYFANEKLETKYTQWEMINAYCDQDSITKEILTRFVTYELCYKGREIEYY